MVPSRWKTNGRERGDHLFILPGGLLFKLNHCAAAVMLLYTAVCAGREAQLLPNIGASPATSRCATLQWGAVVEMHCSFWSACSAGSTQQTEVHFNHTVCGYIFKIRHVFKTWQPHPCEGVDAAQDCTAFELWSVHCCANWWCSTLLSRPLPWSRCLCFAVSSCLQRPQTGYSVIFTFQCSTSSTPMNSFSYNLLWSLSQRSPLSSKSMS